MYIQCILFWMALINFDAHYRVFILVTLHVTSRHFVESIRLTQVVMFFLEYASHLSSTTDYVVVVGYHMKPCWGSKYVTLNLHIGICVQTKN